jgi:hypothetical protein
MGLGALIAADIGLVRQHRIADGVQHFHVSHRISGRAGHPKNLVMLAADAFGVMPPIAKLTPAQAISLKLGDVKENEVRDLSDKVLPTFR